MDETKAGRVEVDEELLAEDEHFAEVQKILDETNARNEDAIVMAELDKAKRSVEDKAAYVRKMLSDMLQPAFLDDLAKAVGESGVDLKFVNERTLAKILLNAKLYEGYGSLRDLVEGSDLRGLRPRDFTNLRRTGVRVDRRPLPEARSRQTKARAVANRPKGVTADFAHAKLLVSDSLFDVTYDPFRMAMSKALSMWSGRANKAHREYESKGKRDPLGYVRRLLDESHSTVTDGVALAPLSSYLSAALAVNLDYEEQAARAVEFGSVVAATLSLPGLAGKACLRSIRDLPAGGPFVDKYIAGVEKPDGEGYFKTHAREVFQKLLDCYAFALVGRFGADGAGTKAIGDLAGLMRGVGRASSLLVDEAVPNETFAVASDGHTEIFSVMGADAARSLLWEAVVYCAGTRAYLDKAWSRLNRMFQEATIHMMSLGGRRELPNLKHYAMKFGTTGLW